MRREVAWVAVLGLLLVSGRPRPLPELDTQMVLFWTPSTCAEEARFVAESQSGEADWTEVALPVGIPPDHEAAKLMDPGDCIAFKADNAPTFRACCANDEAADCIEASTLGPNPQCMKIYHYPTGRQYEEEKVAAWNEANDCDPTAVVNASIHCNCEAPLVCEPDPTTGKVVCRCKYD